MLILKFALPLCLLTSSGIFRCSEHDVNKTFIPALRAITSATDSVSPTVQTSQSAAFRPLMAARIENEKLLKREGYSVSYNPQTRQPNYVSWVLFPQRITGKAQRSRTFFEDPELRTSEKATLDDYRSSGYDRGHICPAGDNKWSATAMLESFYLSNICPQKHTLNNGSWKVLEEACRDWVRANHDTIYIVSGPIFNKDTKPRMLHKHVRIPDAFFKSLVCLSNGKQQGIAFIYQNNTENQPLETCVKSIDQIEALTGYDLFCELNKELQAQLESQANLNDWQP